MNNNEKSKTKPNTNEKSKTKPTTKQTTKKLKLKMGELNELLFLKDMEKFFNENNHNIEMVKTYDKFYPIDFILTKLNDTWCYIELKSRINYDDEDLKLFISYSKINYIKAFKMKNVIIVWWNMETLSYFYVLLTNELIDELLNSRTKLVCSTRTIIVDKKYVSKTKSINDIGKIVVDL